MNKNLYVFLLINLIGGIAVLASYAHGLSTQIELRGLLWGHVPETIRSYYTICMILAAIGYFFFTPYIIKHIFNAQSAIINPNIISLLYLGITIPSALWMPMTFEMLINPSTSLWIAIRIILCIVGLSSTGLMLIFLFSNINKASPMYFMAIAGLIPFWIQTMILDAIIWPYYFK
tara:strand:+ start:3488 stop:4012 length:525 start_codon:yes stop_codon:yes gene_type:complete